MTRKKQSFDLLAEAVAKYIKKQGGKVIVFGDVRIEQWPTDPQFNYRLSIGIVGEKPLVVRQQ